MTAQTDIDVTEQVCFDPGDIDSETLPLRRCVCGQEWGSWEHYISIYRKGAYKCLSCGRALYFVNSIRIYEVRGTE
jgi:hypothetical protein